MKRKEMPRPIVGIGHSMGGAHLSVTTPTATIPHTKQNTQLTQGPKKNKELRYLSSTHVFYTPSFSWTP